jgi:hypothetical protein
MIWLNVLSTQEIKLDSAKAVNHITGLTYYACQLSTARGNQNLCAYATY